MATKCAKCGTSDAYGIFDGSVGGMNFISCFVCGAPGGVIKKDTFIIDVLNDQNKMLNEIAKKLGVNFILPSVKSS